MIQVRIKYIKKSEMQQAVKSLEKDFDIISLVEEYKGKNPKYANSKYKTAYLDAEVKEG